MIAFHSFLKYVCFAVLVQFFALQIVKANPEGGQVVGGSAQITQAGETAGSAAKQSASGDRLAQL